MNTWFRKVILGTVIALSVFATPSVARADDYWDNYWSWYDGSYRPYYYQRYPRYYDRYSDRDYNRSYDGYYNGTYYQPGYYYQPYRDYGTSRFGYQEYSDGGGAVRVGPLRFGWR